MNMTAVVTQIRRGVAETLDQSLSEHWDSQTPEEFAREVEEAIREFSDLPDRVREAHRQCYLSLLAMAGKKEAVDLRQLGDSLIGRFDSALMVMRPLSQWMQRLKQKNVAVEGGEELERKIAELERFRKETNERWPWPMSAKEWEEAVRECEEEGGYSLEETFAHAAGVSVEEWLKKVEDHKRRTGR
jgi:hypothetical protein